MSSLASSFTTPRKQNYDVFISFRGTDTRNNFVSHLHEALCKTKIKTFIDDNLRRGDDVSEALLRTIEESKISIVIFSENYAASRWCLDELVQIMECNEKNAQTVIPVFLNIDPTHIRHQSESFARALAMHGDNPKIQRWRNALTRAANLSGWPVPVTRPEAKIIKKIVLDILRKLRSTSSNTFDNLVGMGSRIDMILKAISEGDHIIGLCGMGGIGKTTIAGAFFRHLSSQFEGHCIIENFREKCEKHGLDWLLDSLVGELLNDRSINKGTSNLEYSFIRDRLRHMKALIVLDDINDLQHIDHLVKLCNCLGRESIVVITSRNKEILRNVVDKICEVPGLDTNEALCLFARNAFKQEHPRDDHQMNLSNRVIKYANGNPLALKILGCYLFGRSNEVQESALSKLAKMPHNTIQKVLRISYDELDNEEKNIFLNIACLFKWKTKDWIEQFHDNCGYSAAIGIGVLVDKCLITVDMFDTVSMHDLLEQMGKEIVRNECIEKPGKRSRLWDVHDIYRVLTKNTGTKTIKGIYLHNGRVNINRAAFKRMHNLEFLDLYPNLYLNRHVICSQGLEYLPNQLRFLHWSDYPLPYLPSNFHGENLVELLMPGSKIVLLWNGRQNLPHLRKIDLRFCVNLIEIPDLTMAPNLQNLKLSGCSKMKRFPMVSMNIKILCLARTAIEEVPSSIDRLTSLIRLDLQECKRLKNLPDEIGKLKSLEKLILYFSYMKKREHLEEGNIHLRQLPDSLGCLFALKELWICGGDFLQIPVSIKQLTNLESLCMSDCMRLQSLPQLPMNIQFISVTNCVSLEVVASPLTTATRREFDSVNKHIVFDFIDCFRLNQNARNSIAKDAESKLQQWEVNYPETFSKSFPTATSQNKESYPMAIINFLGGDVPDWFKYKSLGSSLTVELPKHWCNSDLLYLGVGAVLEFTDFVGYGDSILLEYDCYIRNNIVDCSSGTHSFNVEVSRTEDAIQSNHVYLQYGQSCMINEWRMIPKETDDAAVISIEFRSKDFDCKVKKCGIHLLYKHECEDKCRNSMIDSNFPIGLIQSSSNPDCIWEDMEETVIGDAKRDGGSNDNCCNTDNPGVFSAPMRRKKMRK